MNIDNEDDEPMERAMSSMGRRRERDDLRDGEGRLMRLKHWSVVLRHYDAVMSNDVPYKTLPPWAEFWCGKWEKGKQGSVHFQAVLITKESVTRPHVQRLAGFSPAAGFEPITKDVYKAIMYTKKKETALLDDNGEMTWYSLGEMPPPPADATWTHLHAKIVLERANMTTLVADPTTFSKAVMYSSGVRAAIASLSTPLPRPTQTTIYIQGLSGAGKSYYARTHLARDGFYNRPDMTYWEGFDHTIHKRVLFDDHRLDRKWEQYTDLLSILDPAPKTVNVKNTSQPLNTDMIVMTSNIPMKLVYDDYFDKRMAAERRALRSTKVVEQERIAWERRWHIVIEFDSMWTFKVLTHQKQPDLEGVRFNVHPNFDTDTCDVECIGKNNAPEIEYQEQQQQQQIQGGETGRSPSPVPPPLTRQNAMIIYGQRVNANAATTSSALALETNVFESLEKDVSDLKLDSNSIMQRDLLTSASTK